MGAYRLLSRRDGSRILKNVALSRLKIVAYVSHVAYMSRCCCWYDITRQNLNDDTYATTKNSQKFVGLDVVLSCSLNVNVALSRGSENRSSCGERLALKSKRTPSVQGKCPSYLSFFQISYH